MTLQRAFSTANPPATRAAIFSARGRYFFVPIDPREHHVRAVLQSYTGGAYCLSVVSSASPSRNGGTGENRTQNLRVPSIVMPQAGSISSFRAGLGGYSEAESTTQRSSNS